MKILVAGVRRMAGTSKAGSLFDMTTLSVLTPVERQSGKINIDGAGYSVMELPVDVAVLAQFMGLKYPANYDVVIEPRPRSGRLESTVVGLAEPAKLAA